jgi:hypothetical protein
MAENKVETGMVPSAGTRGLLAITGGSSPIPTPDEIVALTTHAAWTFRSRQFPQYPSAESIYVGMCWMREMGINMMMGLSKGYVVKGKFDVEAKLKLASIQARIRTFEFSFPETTDAKCVFRARLLPTDPWTQTEYTIERAQSAGYTKNREGKEDPTDVWQANRQEMLQWRAITRWLNLYAGHALYTMGGLAAVDALDAEPESLSSAVEVVEELEPVAAPAPASAVHPDPPPSALPDWKAEWVRLAKRQGYTSGRGSAPKLLELANLLMQHLGFKSVRSSSELGVVDYQNMVKEMQRRGWDTAVQKDEPAPPVRDFGEQHAESQVEDVEVERPVGLSAPVAQVAQVIEPFVEPAQPEPEPMERTAQSGDVSAIIALGCKLETAMKSESNITRQFIQEFPQESGNWWFVDQDILTACGCATIVEGKPTVNTVLLETQSEPDKDQEASEALRQMLGAKLVEVNAEFEARTRGPKGIMGARSQAALETSRRGK